MQHNTLYTIGFSAVVCIVCSLMVSTSAVYLKSRQEANIHLDRQKSVLQAVGLLKPGQSASAQEIATLFKQIEPKIVNLQTGEYEDSIDPGTFDQSRAMRDPEQSTAAPPNAAQVARVPRYAQIYQVYQNGKLDMLVLPIEGKGLWSTLYGYLALDSDTTTIRGITFYQHGETPGLGGEVDNPRWKSLWQGRRAFDRDWNPAIRVIKGQAGTVDEDPYQVDGLSGATITSRSVSHMMEFWLGEHGFGPFLERIRTTGRVTHG